LVITITNCKHN